jgi:uncharacterized repeat protein (TIGR01451 family)
MRLRGIGFWLAVVAVAVLSATAMTGVSAMAGAGAVTVKAQEPADDPSLVYVTNRSTNGAGHYNVSVVNPAPPGTITKNIQVEGGPEGIAVTPDGTKAYVANNFAGTVSVIDTANEQVENTIFIGFVGPRGVAVNPDGSEVYIANAFSDTVSVISTTTNTVTATIRVGFAPQAVAFSPDGKTAYVANESTRNVSVINTATRAQTSTIPVDGAPTDVAVSPDGTKVYVTVSEGKVFVINTATSGVTATIPVGTRPLGVAVSPDGSRVYVTNSGSHTVSVIGTSNTVIGVIPGFNVPIGLAVSPDGAAVYVVNNGGHSLSVIEAMNDRIIETIPGFFSPYWVAVAPPPRVPPPPADVSITKSASPTVTASGTITYTLTVTNHGPGDAGDVTVQDELNQHLTGVSGLPPECMLIDATVTCDLGTMSVGEMRQVTFTARVARGVPAGTNIENCASVYSTTRETSEADKDQCAQTEVVPVPPVPANLSVVKTGPADVRPGGTITYTFTVANHGPGRARDVVVNDVLSDEFSAITGVPSGCTLADRTITCTIGTLAAGRSRTFTVTATVSAAATPGTEVQDCATVSATTPQTDDSHNESCTQTEVVTTPPPPPPTRVNVAITKSGPATTTPDGTATYTETVANHGPVGAQDTVVSDVFPAELTVIGVPSGCALADRTITCTVGTLAADASKTFTETARVSADAAPESVVENCATVESSTPDSDLADNGSCTPATVESVPPPDTDVTITKTGPAGVSGGAEAVYTLTVANVTGVDAHDVVVGDVFADEVTVTAIPSGCSLAGRTLTCVIGLLPAGATRTFSVTVTLARDLVPGSVVENSATVYTDTTETDLPNNASTVETVVSPGPPPVPVTG